VSSRVGFVVIAVVRPVIPPVGDARPGRQDEAAELPLFSGPRRGAGETGTAWTASA
jgi:hypothetical protein